MPSCDFITHSLLVSILDYSPDTGEFKWRPRPIGMFQGRRECSIWNSNFAGKKAGCKAVNGYIYITIMNKSSVPAHRLAWLYVNKRWPELYIDHINGDPTDNRIQNLREADAFQNASNAKTRTDNKSGHKNVFWNSQKEKWHVRLNVRGKATHIGLFDDLDKAARAAEKARMHHHKEFSRCA